MRIVPAHPDRTLTMHLGYGRTSAGELGTAVGFDAQRGDTLPTCTK